jgi:hypothetical protein
MAKQFSTALQNFIANRGSIHDGLNNGVLVLFSGTQPATADLGYATNSASPLIAFTEGSGVITKQVDPYFSLELSTTHAANYVTSITLNGLPIIDASATALLATSASTFATSLISAINNHQGALKCFATAGAGNIVKVFLPKNTGASLNTLDTLVVLRTTSSTLELKVNNTAINAGWSSDTGTVADVIAAGSYSRLGVAGVNLLNMITSTAGIATKETVVWTGIAGTDAMNTAFGTAGFTGFTSGTGVVTWFRYYATLDDPELAGTTTADTTYQYLRYDGSVGTTTAYDMVASGGTTLVYGATQTIPSFSFTVPATQS